MNSDLQQPKEMHLDGVGLKLAGCLWNSEATQNFIGLHGWLDNAASLEPLARELVDIQMLCLDMAGQGRSDFRSADARYDIDMDVGDIISVADRMGWKEFGLIAHSRGALVASLTAGTFPERISHLILLDGGGSYAFEAEQRPERLARFILESRKLADASGTLFDSREKAVQARMDGMVPVAKEVAELLAQRSLLSEANGFRWRADQRTKATSPSPLDARTLEAFYRRIDCPVLQMLATEDFQGVREKITGPVELLKNYSRVVIEGGHHVHSEKPAEVAAAIRAWLQSPTSHGDVMP